MASKTPALPSDEATKQRLLRAISLFESSTNTDAHSLMLEVPVPCLSHPPSILVDRNVRVYWPDDDAWYLGDIVAYDEKTGKHRIHYEDGAKEEVWLAVERVRLIISAGEYITGVSSSPSIQSTSIEYENVVEELGKYVDMLEKAIKEVEINGDDGDETQEKIERMQLKVAELRTSIATASLKPSTIDNGTTAPPAEEGTADIADGKTTEQPLECISIGSVVWGSVRGFPPWPALVVTPQHVTDSSKPLSGRRLQNIRDTAPIVYFGTFERQHLKRAAITGFRQGTENGWFMAKTRKKRQFAAAICEAISWLSDGEVPEGMFPNNDEVFDDEDDSDDDDGRKGAKKRKGNTGYWNSKALTAPGMPMIINKNLRILSLGRIEWLHPSYHDEKTIYPIGYKAIRTISTPASNNVPKEHLCEILEGKEGPLFRVTVRGGCAVEGSTANKAWSLLYMNGADKCRTTTRTKSKGKKLEDANDNSGSNKENTDVASCAKGTTLGNQSIPYNRVSAGQRFIISGGNKHFGLTMPKVAVAIMKLPNAPRCERFAAWPDDADVEAPPPLTAEEELRKLQLEIKLCKLPEGVQGVKFGRQRPGVCHVCNEEEEDDEDLMLQCDGCGTYVHMGCYAVSQPPHTNQVWLCDPCKVSSTSSAPPPACCLCPIVGGALKRTTCGRWAHPACALWLPEPSLDTQLSYGNHIKLQGLLRDVSMVHGSRMKLTCCLCKQPHGACVQCCEQRCFAAYHILCARQAGWLTQMVDESESEDEEQNDGAIDENMEEDDALIVKAVVERLIDAVVGAKNGRKRPRSVVTQQGIKIGNTRLLAFCGKHSGTSTQAMVGINSARKKRRQNAVAPIVGGFDAPAGDESQPAAIDGLNHNAETQVPAHGLNLVHLSFQSPNSKGRKIAQVLLAGEQRSAPGGTNGSLDNTQIDPGCARARQYHSLSRRHQRAPEMLAAAAAKRLYVQATPMLLGAPRTAGGACLSLNTPNNVASQVPKSITQRYNDMTSSLCQRIAPGKSAIHGWGAFAVVPHVRDQMVIEYCGDLVRPSVADWREKRVYDGMVGAGTYVFRLNATQCVDATQSGNLAHLLNHSCAPNCYSRTIGVWDESSQSNKDHVILFALRDIAPWEELTYDYRFSGSEQLKCNCGAETCSGAVNNEKSLMMNTGNGTVEKQEGVLVVLKKEVKAYVAKE